jgi:hypothetical protein
MSSGCAPPVSRSKKKSRAALATAGEPFFADQAKEDLAWWRKTNPRMLARIDSLLVFRGLGRQSAWRGRAGCSAFPGQCDFQHRLQTREPFVHLPRFGGEIPDLHRLTNHLLVHFDHLGERVPDPVRDAHGHAAFLRLFAK